MPSAMRVIMLTSPRLSARQAAEMNGQPPHQTTGVARRKPKIPMESPKGGIAGRPSILPIVTHGGLVGRGLTMPRRCSDFMSHPGVIVGGRMLLLPRELGMTLLHA